jgi:tRNA-dihydrouridine synthase
VISSFVGLDHKTVSLVDFRRVRQTSVCRLEFGLSLSRIGINLPDARAIKKAVSVPVICTGGFQTASVIQNAISDGSCDAVSIARPLIANNDLVKMFAQGLDRAPQPCTYCNKCLVNVVENPLGCYEESRFKSREEMIEQICWCSARRRSHNDKTHSAWWHYHSVIGKMISPFGAFRCS